MRDKYAGLPTRRRGREKEEIGSGEQQGGGDKEGAKEKDGGMLA
jgi:hypothetical protein